MPHLGPARGSATPVEGAGERYGFLRDVVVDIPHATANRTVRVVRAEGLLREIRPASGRRAAILAFAELLNIAEGRPAF